MATTQKRGLTHPYSPNPPILFSPFIPERKKGDVAGPSFSAAPAGLTRDDFTPLKGLCEAVHLLLGEQQVKVVLGERESEVSGHRGQRQMRSPGSRGMGTFPPKRRQDPRSQPPLTVKETKALKRGKVCSELSEFGEESSLESRYLAKPL